MSETNRRGGGDADARGTLVMQATGRLGSPYLAGKRAVLTMPGGSQPDRASCLPMSCTPTMHADSPTMSDCGAQSRRRAAAHRGGLNQLLPYLESDRRPEGAGRPWRHRDGADNDDMPLPDAMQRDRSQHCQRRGRTVKRGPRLKLN